MSADLGRVAFVGGNGRSGSTLIELALGQLPQACPLGELRHMWQRGIVDNESCGCGQPFADCPFWTAVGAKAFGGWNQVDVERALHLQATVDRTRQVPRLLSRRSGEGFKRQVEEYVDLYREIYQAARSVSGKSLIVDSSKHISMAACLLYAEGLDLRVVHVVRHPLGVAHSWTKLKLRPEITSHEAYMPQYSPLRVSLEWDTHQALFELLRLRGRPQMLLRYEDFVARPAPTLSAVAGFLGEPGAPEWADPSFRTVTPGLQHAVAGNPLRFVQGPIEVRSDEGWRTGLSSLTKAEVVALTLPLTPRYGYLSTGVRALAKGDRQS